jgi:hypothetical protein
MAMPRSRGGNWSTRLPPIHTSPWVGLSRPAMMRNSVVLPQPEAPSSTMNSWSAMGQVDRVQGREGPKALGDTLDENLSHGGLSLSFCRADRTGKGPIPL